MKDDLGKRMVEALAASSRGGDRMNWQEVAERVGVTRQTLYKWRSGKSSPSPQDLAAFARETNVEYRWLATGEGPMRFTGIEDTLVEAEVETWNPTLNPSGPDDTAIVIPVYNVEAAAGPGFINDVEAIHSKFPFERSELVKRGISPSQAAAIYVSGDSMKGSLEPGEIIFFAHQTDMRVISGSIYIIRMGDTVMVKRLVGKTPSLLVAMSDNKNYEPLEINLKDEWLDFHIIGRVFASIKWH